MDKVVAHSHKLMMEAEAGRATAEADLAIVEGRRDDALRVERVAKENHEKFV